jgi:hypothetical protein
MNFSLFLSFKQFVLTVFSKILSPTSKNLAGYMSLTYSITGLLVVLGVAGKHVMAADVAIVQGAVLATFYVLSGDARHLILSDKAHANNVVFFRLVWILPLAILSYFMSTIAGHVESVIAYGLILRRCTEWLAEPHVTEIERQNGKWSGWYLQPIIFMFFVGQLVFTDQLWLIWIWAISPIIFSLNFIAQAKPHNFFNFGWENITSTAVIGFTGYIQRVLIVSLVGKQFSGMLFPGFAIGSFVGTMAANVAGPTLFRKGLHHSVYFTIALIALLLVGGLVFFSSETVIYKTIGLSIIGGAVMIAAQQSRLSLLKNSHTLELDLLFQLSLVFMIPALYFVAGMQWMIAFYLLGSIIAWVYYKGSLLAEKFNHVWKNRLLVLIVLGLVSPIFFQLSRQIYNGELVAIINSAGSLKALPMSLFFCYMGVILFSVGYDKSKPVILTISAMFLILIASTMIVNQGLGKLILLVQYIVPTVALLLGVALGHFNRKLTAKAMLYFLVFFVPTQLVITWMHGQLALTHYMYLFSVYQHYQYVPLVMAALYVWVWVELRDTHTNWIYYLAPWMAMYVAAGNSLLALFGLVVFVCAFAFPARKRKLDTIIPVIILATIAGYFYLNSQMATEISVQNNSSWPYSHSVQAPVSVVDRESIAVIYVNDMVKDPFSILYGHLYPPLRGAALGADSYYLDLVYNFGVFACLPLLALLFYTIVRSSQQRAGDDSMVWLLAIVLYFVMIDSNLKVTLLQPYSGIVVFFLWGILLSKLNSRTREHSINGLKL